MIPIDVEALGDRDEASTSLCHGPWEIHIVRAHAHFLVEAADLERKFPAPAQEVLDRRLLDEVAGPADPLGHVNRAEGSTRVVDDSPGGMEEVAPGVVVDVTVEHLDRVSRPHVVGEQQGDEGRLGVPHASVQRSRHAPTLVQHDPDPRIGPELLQRSGHLAETAPLRYQEHLPACRGLRQDGSDRLLQVRTWALLHGQQDGDHRLGIRFGHPGLLVSLGRAMSRLTLHRVGQSRLPEFHVKGYRSRHLFAHDIYHVPKCGPDGYKLAGRMAGDEDLDHQWQVLLYAAGPMLEEFPRSLFFDDDVLWHQQHFGVPGQVASATVLIEGPVATSLVHQSDLVQRIGRAREFKSRIENRFKGWPSLLFNAVAAFAYSKGARMLRTPTADLALRHTDPARSVGRPLFDRVYDHPVSGLGAEGSGDWWVVDLEGNRDRIVFPHQVVEEIAEEPVVCVTHDLEHGLGHLDVDPAFAADADDAAADNLSAMLEVERSAGVRATYNVVGCLLEEVHEQLRSEGHCVAFHSFDHRLGGFDGPPGAPGADQLARCRQVDYRLKGYRAPRSILTPDLSAERLAFHNFEWLASSRHSLGFDEPRLERRIARLPVTVDDFALHTGELTYSEWEALVLGRAASSRFTCIGLHDCYAPTWLGGYHGLLDSLGELGRLRTLDEVAAGVFLENAE
jgi:peptidoglycan/xylan/chitin deacetylase (PgdA/CDA1 family)